MKIASDIADVLQYIHHDCESPIIHCDFKPGNILLNYDMTARLGDFGIARFYMKSKSAAARDSSSVCTTTSKGLLDTLLQVTNMFLPVIFFLYDNKMGIYMNYTLCCTFYLVCRVRRR